jgi:parallel beta-helix repeat protein
MLDFNRIRAGFAVAIALGLVAVLAPATAAAADAYVDDSGHAGAPCTLPSPCNSITTGIGQASAGATVHIDGGTYNEAVTLGAGKSLIEDDFNSGDGGSNQVTINGAGSSAITVSGSNAGTIQGLTINSGSTSPVELDNAATFTQNTVNSDPTVDGTTIVYVPNVAASGSVLSGNTITGSTTPGVVQVGIEVDGATATVTGNTITNASEGIFVGSGANPTISANTISGTHAAGTGGLGIAVIGARATISGNLIHLPGTGTDGIDLSPSGATSVSRTSVIGPGFSEGIHSENGAGPVQLDSDLITGSTSGIEAKDDSPTLDAGEGDVSMANMTVWGNSTDLSAINADLTIDSSIVEDPVFVDATSPGDVACTITFSRGPTTTAGADGCTHFQTIAAPDLGGSDGFHLLDTPNNRVNFIDRGNPAGSAGSLDLDGLPRRIDADGACPLNQVLDLGAHEFQIAQPDCSPPTTTPPTPQSPAKKPTCKKHKKRNAASQAKKKKCKRRK